MKTAILLLTAMEIETLQLLVEGAVETGLEEDGLITGLTQIIHKLEAAEEEIAALALREVRRMLPGAPCLVG